MPVTVTSLDWYSFYNCDSLLRINSTSDGVFVLPSAIRMINESCLWNVQKLTQGDIPAIITVIYQQVFSECPYLLTVNMAGIVPPELGYHVFDVYDTSNLSFIINVPSGALANYDAVASWDPYMLNIK